MSVGLVIFDCDGTLVDSEGLAAESMAAVSAEFGLPMTTAQAALTFRGWRMQDCVDWISAQLGRVLPDEFTTRYRERLAGELRDRVQPIVGAQELLAGLSVPFCVASSGPREKIELTLGATGLLQHFEMRIFSAYEVGFWKPDPRLFLHAAATMGVLPAHCLVVEDSVPGLQAGIAAGMQVVALQSEGVDHRIDASIELIRALDQLPNVLARRNRIALA